MSEKLTYNSGDHEPVKVQSTEQIHDKKAEQEAKSVEAKHNTAKALETIRHNIEQQAISKEKSATEKETAPTAVHITKELKEIKFNETMHYVRRRLTPTQRKLSTFIHIPSVEKVSEVGAKTVARPSGLMGGGIVALSGSLAVLYIARHIGFEVPNSLFMVLFVAGFLVGIIAELLYKSLTVRNRRNRAYKTQ